MSDNQIILAHGVIENPSIIEQMTPAELFAAGGTDIVFETVKREVDAFVPDMTTADGRKEIAAIAYKIARTKTFIDKTGETFNADLKKKTKAVDAERRRIWDKLEALQKEIRAPLTEWETIEELRVEQHKECMGVLEHIHVLVVGATPDDVRERMGQFQKLLDRDWQEFSDIASPLLAQQNELLAKMLVDAEQRERDRLELEELRKVRAVQAEKDAEEARQKAAQEERARIEAKARADANARAVAIAEAAEKHIRESEAARIVAEQKAKEDAEEAVLQERQRIAEQKRKEEAEAAARENDRAHRSKVNNEILAALMRLKIDEDVGKSIITAIVIGKIPHTKISY